jgi:hypothetical protein
MMYLDRFVSGFAKIVASLDRAEFYRPGHAAGGRARALGVDFSGRTVGSLPRMGTVAIRIGSSGLYIVLPIEPVKRVRHCAAMIAANGSSSRRRTDSTALASYL